MSISDHIWKQDNKPDMPVVIDKATLSVPIHRATMWLPNLLSQNIISTDV